MLSSVVTFFADYLKTRPFRDVLTITALGIFIWLEYQHGDRTDNAHKVLHEILQERDANEQKRTEANERNTDRIISALTGVKAEVKKTTAEVQKLPEATAAAVKQ